MAGGGRIGVERPPAIGRTDHPFNQRFRRPLAASGNGRCQLPILKPASRQSTHSYSTGETSTATFIAWLPPPRTIPLTGQTSP